MDGDGLEEIAASGGGTALRGWGKRVTLAGSGSVSMDDFDNNGRGDVLVYDHTSEALIIHRGMDSGVAPAAALATHRALRGPVFMGDVDGDGVLELLSVDEDGDLVHTQASTYVEAEQDGDTGR
jgi:hypothetical protein